MVNLRNKNKSQSRRRKTKDNPHRQQLGLHHFNRVSEVISPYSHEYCDMIYKKALDYIETIGFRNFPSINTKTIKIDDNYTGIPSNLVMESLTKSCQDIVFGDKIIGKNAHKTYIAPSVKASLFYDYEAKNFRAAGKDDIDQAIKLINHYDICDFATLFSECDTVTYHTIADQTQKPLLLSSDDIDTIRNVKKCHHPVMLMFHITAPPMRFSQRECKQLQEYCEEGINSNHAILLMHKIQIGATASANLEHAVIQAFAENLASYYIARHYAPAAKILCGYHINATDLRNGLITSAGAEHALIQGLLCRLHHYLNLPIAISLAHSNSKTPDYQAALEKSQSLHTLLQHRCDMIINAAGNIAGVFAASLQALVCDCDMLYQYLRLCHGIFSQSGNHQQEMGQALQQQYYFLGLSQTLDAMKNQFYYSQIADTIHPELWTKFGGLDTHALTDFIKNDIINKDINDDR